jgi:hypothetical protein
MKNKRMPLVLRFTREQLALVDWLAVEMSSTPNHAAKVAVLHFINLYAEEKKRREKAERDKANDRVQLDTKGDTQTSQSTDDNTAKQS